MIPQSATHEHHYEGMRWREEEGCEVGRCVGGVTWLNERGELKEERFILGSWRDEVGREVVWLEGNL